MSEGQQGGNSNLQKQDLSQLDVTKLHPLSPEVISRQATVNLGTIGHVAHGKSTIVKAISGVHTVRFKNELERNITIKLDGNEVKTNPDVDYISNSCDDQVVQCNGSVISLENGDDQILNKKRLRKQMTILDYCKSSKIKSSIELEPLSFEYDVKVHSSPSPSPSISSTVTITSQELGSEGSSLSPASSISSLATVKSRKRNHSKTLSSPVSAELVKKQRREGNAFNRSGTPANKSNEKTGVTNNLETNSLPKSKRSSMKTTAHKKSHEKNTSINESEVKETSSPNNKVRVNKSTKAKKSDEKNDSVEEGSYTVEKVVGIDVIENTPHFHIKWKGYSASHNTWEPLSNLDNCLNLVRKFLEYEVGVRKDTIENILLDLSTNNVFKFTDEEAFLKLNKFDSISLLSHLVLLAIMKKSKDGPDESYNVIFEKLREKEDFMLFSYWIRRNEQLKALEEWQNRINELDKSSQITVENNFDFEKAPSTFEYINDCVAGEGVNIPDDPLIGCDCKDGCSIRSNCCGKQLGSEYAYTSTRGIRLAQGNAVFECNKLCKCGAECTNRVVQQGRKHSLTIFKTSNGRGWGVRTDRVIAKGQFICEYVGEIITNKEAEARGLIYDAEKRTYLFDLDCNSIVENKENLYTIDACKIGNVSRMINHSCDPNIGTWSVWINCLDLDIPKICFYALRRIEAGEELSFDYLSFSVHDVDTEVDTNNDQPNVKTNFECKCDSAKCRKYIFDPDLLNPVDC